MAQAIAAADKEELRGELIDFYLPIHTTQE